MIKRTNIVRLKRTIRRRLALRFWESVGVERLYTDRINELNCYEKIIWKDENVYYWHSYEAAKREIRIFIKELIKLNKG